MSEIPGETQDKLYVPIQWIYKQRPWLLSVMEHSLKLPDQSFPGWTLTGSAWDGQTKMPVEEIVVVNGAQVVIGSGLSAVYRPDLSHPTSGWHAYLRGAQSIGNSAIYGVVDGGRSARLIARIPAGI